MPTIGTIIRSREINRNGSRKYIWKACLDCGKERWIRLSGEKPLSIRCSHCSNKKNQQGKNHSRWKGGKIITQEGYVLIWTESISAFALMRNRQGYIPEHRLVMAKHLDRCLESWEIVHHKNHIRNDNRIENLELLSDIGHKQLSRLEMMINRLRDENKQLKVELQRRIK